VPREDASLLHFLFFHYMSMKVTKNKRGRPRVSPNSVRMNITISLDDFELLERLSAHSASRPATLVRQLIMEARPTFIGMVEAIEANRNNTKPPAGSLAERMLKHALSGTQPSQLEILEMVNDINKSKK